MDKTQADAEARRGSYEHAKRTLDLLGYWPTPHGAEMMQDPRQQEVMKEAAKRYIDRLDGSAAMAVMILANALAGGEAGDE
jgi:hypothetical protein